MPYKLGILFAVSLLGGVFVFPQDKGIGDLALLERKLSDREIRGDSIYQVLGDIASGLQLPIGFENLTGSGGCRLTAMVTLKTTGMTVRQLLDAVEARSSNCDWEVRDNVINFFSRSASRRLANVKMGMFMIQAGTTRRDIKLAIEGSPDLRRELESSEYVTFPIDPLIDDRPISQSFTLSRRRYELRDILNSIVKETPSKYWTLLKWENSDSTILITF